MEITQRRAKQLNIHAGIQSFLERKILFKNVKLILQMPLKKKSAKVELKMANTFKRS